MTKKTPGADVLRHNPFAELAKQRGVAAPDPNKQPAAGRSAPRAAPHTARGVRFHLEAEGRSGKVSTRVTGLPAHNLAAIAERLGSALGCRASVQGADVLLAGSLAERAAAWLTSAGDLSSLKAKARPAPVHTAPRQEDEPCFQSAPDAAATVRSSVRRGASVSIVLKADQDTGKLTRGVVRELLTSSASHPRGIKVRLETGEVGRVQKIHGD